MTQIWYDTLLKLDNNTVDRWLLDLQDVINSSENYDWTCNLINVVENLQNGHFDIEIYNDNELHIFGIYIEKLDKKILDILLTGTIE